MAPGGIVNAGFYATHGDALTIASGVLTLLSGGVVVVSAESSTTDTLDSITLDSTLDANIVTQHYIWVYLIAAAGHTITLTDDHASLSANQMAFAAGANVTITDTHGVLLFRIGGLWMDSLGSLQLSGGLADLTGVQTLTNKNVVQPKTDFASAGAITIKNGVARLTGGSAITYTLADPINVTDDGKELRIFSSTAQAHKVDNSAGSGFNGGGASVDFANFGGAIGDNIHFIADAGHWNVLSTRNVTIAAS